jgi:magnesium transporter
MPLVSAPPRGHTRAAMLRLATLLGPDLKETLARDPDELLEALEEFHPEDIAEVVSGLEDLDTSVALVRALPDEFRAEVLERVDDEVRARILEKLGTEEAAEVLAEMSADERVDALQELPEAVAEKILDRLEETEPEVAEEVRELAAYPEGTAGALMTTEYVSVSPETKVWQVIEEVRRASTERTAEMISYVYAVAYGHKLVGVASLRDLILADPSKSFADIMTENVVHVPPTMDQEEVARAIAKYDLTALPVVDSTGVMLGVVTVDDVVDVVIAEATEDAQRMGAVSPIEDAYFDTGYWEFVRKRAGWLVVLFLGGLLTATVMDAFEDDMRQMMELVVFIPLIISSGGNSGSQSSSLLIRALAVGEVAPRDWWRVLLREASIGVTLGLILGVVGFTRAYFVGAHGNVAIALVVGVSVVMIVLLGTLVGSLLPLLIKRLGLDPAVSSTPFIASLVDVLGLLVYFTVATTILAVFH